MEIITPKPTKPPRMIVYGKHKIGKSTYAAGFPNPIFVQTEDGLEDVNADVKAFPVCKSWEEFTECMKFLLTEKHDFKTIVIDSLDWTETLIWQHICKENNWQQLGDGPFGAGYKLALTYWDRVTKGLDKLNREKKMWVVLLAHAKQIKFEDPERPSYDKYTLDLHDKSGKLLCEYVDIIGYARLRETSTESKEGFGKVTRYRTTGERVLSCTEKGPYEAGNRYSLPDNLELSFNSLNEELKKHYAKRKQVKDIESGAEKNVGPRVGGGTSDGNRNGDTIGNLSDAKKAKEEAKEKKQLITGQEILDEASNLK